jgi:hypothetical protein
MTIEDGAKLWYVARDGKQTGPISDAEIRAIAGHGYFRPTDLVWRPGFSEWRAALSVFPPVPVNAPPPGFGAPLPPQPEPPQSRTQQPVTQQPVTQQPSMLGPSPAASVPAPRQTPSLQQAIRAAVPAANQPGANQTGAPITGGAMTGGAAGAHAFDPSPSPQYGQPATRTSPASQFTVRPTAPPQAGPDAGSAQPSHGYRPSQGAMSGPTLGRPLTPIATVSEPDDDDHAPQQPEKPRTNRMALAALVITLFAIAGGVLVAAEPAFLKGGPLEPVRRSLASLSQLVVGDSKLADFETTLQGTAHWPVIKREFPDWYGERLREAVKLTSENKPADEVSRMLTERIVALRRQNAAQALSASSPKLMAVANAFLDNLKQLKQKSPLACYSFISQGEMTPAVLELLKTTGGKPPAIQVQVAAIFEAIAEGRKTPTQHEKPQKSDYDTLMTQLGKLGWTQDDIATFADPRALARTEPSRVCQMVQDWFVAHIAIEDVAIKQRLIGETLRPVVSG